MGGDDFLGIFAIMDHKYPPRYHQCSRGKLLLCFINVIRAYGARSQLSCTMQHLKRRTISTTRAKASL